MKQLLDNTEVQLNEKRETDQSIQNRVRWMCEHARGENILDVGCSKGTVSIQLGREGKNVIGIDLLQKSIDDANELLKNESVAIQKFVHFEMVNFMDDEIQYGQEFDCILMGDVLSDITDPQRFINKAKTLLNADGRLVVTVPFGITGYEKKQSQYYAAKLLTLSNDEFGIENMHFAENWVGTIFSKTGNKQVEWNENLVKRLEKAFYTKEKLHMTELNTMQNEIRELAGRLEELQSQDDLLSAKSQEIESLQNQTEEQQKVILGLKRELSEQKQTKVIVEKPKQDDAALKELKETIDTQQNLILTLRQEKVSTQELLLQSYEKEKKLLKSYKDIKRKSERLEKRYNALSLSKLGKTTLKYWDIRKKYLGRK